MAEDEDAKQKEQRQELVEALQGWHRATASASRYNRNLLQYGAGIAAVLGIEAGSGGILAIANSLLGARGEEASLPAWAVFRLGILGVLAAAVTIILAILLVDTYRRRRAAESEAADYRDKLIALEPDQFLPSAE